MILNFVEYMAQEALKVVTYSKNGNGRVIGMKVFVVGSENYKDKKNR